MANLDGKKRRVLLVEDEKDAKVLTALTLAEYKLTCARNEEASSTKPETASSIYSASSRCRWSS
jgi:hypothetical protein